MPVAGANSPAAEASSHREKPPRSLEQSRPSGAPSAPKPPQPGSPSPAFALHLPSFSPGRSLTCFSLQPRSALLCSATLPLPPPRGFSAPKRQTMTSRPLECPPAPSRPTAPARRGSGAKRRRRSKLMTKIGSERTNERAPPPACGRCQLPSAGSSEARREARGCKCARLFSTGSSPLAGLTAQEQLGRASTWRGVSLGSYLVTLKGTKMRRWPRLPGARDLGASLKPLSMY